eukprot:3598238-Alexandrium_andersonii.AAC.1
MAGVGGDMCAPTCAFARACEPWAMHVGMAIWTPVFCLSMGVGLGCVCAGSRVVAVGHSLARIA